MAAEDIVYIFDAGGPSRIWRFAEAVSSNEDCHILPTQLAVLADARRLMTDVEKLPLHTIVQHTTAFVEGVHFEESPVIVEATTSLDSISFHDELKEGFEVLGAGVI